MKTCTKCKEPKDEDAFALERKRGKRVRRAQCRECRKAYLRDYYAKNETYFADYREANAEKISKKSSECNRRKRHERYADIAKLKSAPCTDCDQTFPSHVMDFDHRDPTTKVADISMMVKTYVPWSRILKEIEKCDLVCVRCHRKRTYHGNKNYQTRRYVQNRAAVDLIKELSPCLDCDQHFDACQMDFDHVRGEKADTISQMLGGEEAEIVSEIAKCDLVCANCHRIRTYERPSEKASPKLKLSPEAMRRERSRYEKAAAA